jgi:hypothetical protein
LDERVPAPAVVSDKAPENTPGTALPAAANGDFDDDVVGSTSADVCSTHLQSIMDRRPWGSDMVTASAPIVLSGAAAPFPCDQYHHQQHPPRLWIEVENDDLSDPDLWEPNLWDVDNLLEDTSGYIDDNGAEVPIEALRPPPWCIV